MPYVMLVWRKGNINRTVSVMQYCVLLLLYGAQWYKQFLQVGRLDPAVISHDLALYLLSTSLSLVFLMLYMFLKTLLHCVLYVTMSGAWMTSQPLSISDMMEPR